MGRCTEEEYYDQPPEGTPVDFHLVEQGHTLRFATFLHRIDQTVTRGVGTSNSVRVEDHGTGPLMQLLLGPGTCPLTIELVIARVIAKNVEALVELRRRALSKVQQYHTDLMLLNRGVAALESCLNCQEDPAAIRHLQKELNALKAKRDKSKHRRMTQQHILDRCEKELAYVGELGHPTTLGGASPDTPTSTEETAEAPIEASGSTTPTLPPKEEMEVSHTDSPVRAAEDDLLDDSDQDGSQAQEAGAMQRDTPKEARPDTPPTGGKTPSTGVTTGLSKLSMSSPRDQLAPESEGPTTPQGSPDTAPPEAE